MTKFRTGIGISITQESLSPTSTSSGEDSPRAGVSQLHTSHMLLVMSYLRMNDILRCACVNSKWHRASEDDGLWRRWGGVNVRINYLLSGVVLLLLLLLVVLVLVLVLLSLSLSLPVSLFTLTLHSHSHSHLRSRSHSHSYSRSRSRSRSRSYMLISFQPSISVQCTIKNNIIHVNNTISSFLLLLQIGSAQVGSSAAELAWLCAHDLIVFSKLLSAQHIQRQVWEREVGG
jgi:hypothetical protein